jgi:hypothetical protein
MANGDTDHDGDFDQLYTLGGRSFSIRSAAGALVYDSGDQFEQIASQAFPATFNASNDDNTFDSRSDNKGPEPEGVAVGEVYGHVFAFIALERIGGIMAYDVTDPTNPRFVQYVNNRNFGAAPNTAAAGDLGPEGVHFVKFNDSPTGNPLLIVANEVSGTTTVYEVVPVRLP